MKILCVLLVLFFVFTGCASKKSKKSEGKRKAIPEWVYSPMDGCNKQSQMCASGEGDSLQSADATARKSLASIFETEIKSEFSSNTQSSQEGLDPSTAEYIESTYKSINETVDQSLEGVEIKERHRKDGVFYALAYLDKEKQLIVLEKK